MKKYDDDGGVVANVVVQSELQSGLGSVNLMSCDDHERRHGFGVVIQAWGTMVVLW